MNFDYSITVESTLYLWGSLLLLPLWLYGFIRNKDSRKEMVVCGFLFGVAAVIIGYAYALHDYWNPSYIFDNFLHIEDFIYGFLFGCIASEIFEIVLPYKSVKKKQRSRKKILIIFATITGLCFFIFVDLLNYNSIIAHIVPPLIVGIFCVVYRKDFITPTLLSGIILLIITFIWQSIILLIYPSAISEVWMVENLSGFFINGIPIEELIFAFSLGFGASCFYELVMGYEYVDKKSGGLLAPRLKQ